MDMINIGSRSVLLDDGVDEVTEFSVSKVPISVEQFEEFVRSTGFLTSAELAGDDETFRKNYVLDEYDEEFARRSPVQRISFRDADAYCQWAGAALPTESQWLAAACIDNQLYGYRENVGRLSLLRKKVLIDVTGAEITSTFVDGQVVVRSGPIIVRWKEAWPGRHRHLQAREKVEFGLTFRIVEVKGAELGPSPK